MELARRHSGYDGAYHKQWVIDQMVRALIGDGYDVWVAATKSGKDGPDTHDLDVGIPPWYIDFFEAAYMKAACHGETSGPSISNQENAVQV